MTKSRRDRLMNGSASVVLPRDVVRSAIEKAEAQGLINVDWSNPDRPRIRRSGAGCNILSLHQSSGVVFLPPAPC